MKHCIRYNDAHRGWVAAFDIVKKVPKNSGWRYVAPPPEPHEDDTDGQSHAIREFVDGMERKTRHGGKPHPWKARKADVIAEFKDNTKVQVTPFGFTEAWRPEDHAVADKELAWLIANQEVELPPEWLTMRSNGERGESLDRLQEMDGDEYTLADLVPDGFVKMEDMVHAHALLGGMRRIEAFLQAEDEQKWHTGHTRRYALVVNEAGKRGIVPMSRAITEAQTAEDWHIIKEHLPEPEEALRASEYREAQTEHYTDEQGRRRRRYIPGTFATREDAYEKALHMKLDLLESERYQQDLFEVPEKEYQPNTPCPNSKCEERGEDCVLCFGEKYVLHTIGTHDMDWPPPGWLEDKDGLHITHNRVVREAVNRFESDVVAISRLQRERGLKTR